MPRITSLFICAIATAAFLGATAFADSGPIVSPAADPYYKYGGLKNTKGFGKAKPSEIFYGGDPTGLVCNIRWKTWGARIATGYGTGWYVNSHESVAQGHPAVAIVKAAHLGRWHGKRAYLSLRWSFPRHGTQHVPSC